MNKKISKLADKIDALTLRERGMVFAAMLALLIMVWNSILMEPLNKEQDVLQSELSSFEDLMKTIVIEEETIIKRGSYNPNEKEHKRIVELEKQLQTANKQIEQYGSNVVTPPQMTDLLEKILAEQTNLELISLSSVDARPLLADTKKKQAKKQQQPQPQQDRITLYKHGMNIELAGAYLDVLSFLRAVEKLQWDIFWDAISITITEYPNNRVTIKLHTISLDSAWIGI